MSTINTTQLSKHFGFSIPAELLIKAGVQPASSVKRGYNWHVSSIPEIGEALRKWIATRVHADVDMEALTAKPAATTEPSSMPSFDDDDPDAL